jgi:hypothetical protein
MAAPIHDTTRITQNTPQCLRVLHQWRGCSQGERA